MKKKLVIILSNRRQAQSLLKWIEEKTNVILMNSKIPTSYNPFNHNARILILTDGGTCVDGIAMQTRSRVSTISEIKEYFKDHTVINIRDGVQPVKFKIAAFIEANS